MLDVYLGSHERAIRMRLIALAIQRSLSTTSYKDLWVLLARREGAIRETGPWSRLDTMVADIGLYELQHRRPLLTSLVVGAYGIPDEGFFVLAERCGLADTSRERTWRREIERVREYWKNAIDPAIVHVDGLGPTLSWDPSLLLDTATQAIPET